MGVFVFVALGVGVVVGENVCVSDIVNVSVIVGENVWVSDSVGVGVSVGVWVCVVAKSSIISTTAYPPL